MAVLVMGASRASLIKNDVSTADSLWPLFILRATATCFTAASQTRQ